jgi:hypothetical protein
MTAPGAGAAPAAGAGAAEGGALAGLGGGGGGFYQGNVAAAGTGLASATAVATQTASNGTTTINNVTTTSSQTPLVLPGLFTAINPESALPVDRVFLGYGYFDSFRVRQSVGLTPVTRSGFNLNRLDVGAEKTFLNGLGSIYVRMPFLDATDNSANLPIDGMGDISAGLKFSLLASKETGSTLTAGMTVSAPTSRDLHVTTSSFRPASGSNLDGIVLPPDVTTTVNPTFLQPWVGGLLVLDRLFVQEYLGVVIPTDDRVSTFINNDVALGYQVYRCPGGWLSSVTPTFDVQALLPLNHQGAPAPSQFQPIPASQFAAASTNPAVLGNAVPSGLSLNSPYQVFLSEGVQIGLADRAVLSTGVVTPVTGPKAFTVGVTVGLNFFF